MVEYQKNERREKVEYLQRKNEYENEHEIPYKGLKTKIASGIKIDLSELEELINKTASGE